MQVRVLPWVPNFFVYIVEESVYITIIGMKLKRTDNVLQEDFSAGSL